MSFPMNTAWDAIWTMNQYLADDRPMNLAEMKNAYEIFNGLASSMKSILSDAGVRHAIPQRLKNDFTFACQKLNVPL